jgi:hypothetical protein
VAVTIFITFMYEAALLPKPLGRGAQIDIEHGGSVGVICTQTSFKRFGKRWGLLNIQHISRSSVEHATKDSFIYERLSAGSRDQKTVSQASCTRPPSKIA